MKNYLLNFWFARAIYAFRKVKMQNKQLNEVSVELQAYHISKLEVLLDRNIMISRMRSNAIVAEIGVDSGGFTDVILQLGLPAKLHLVDVWNSKRYPNEKYNEVKKRFARQIDEGQIVIDRGYSTDVLNTYPNDYFDWIYLDSDHGYEVTRNELELLRYKVKNKGVISGHDYCRFKSDGSVRFGVIEAVNEFCVKYNCQFLYLTMESNRHLSFSICNNRE